MDGSIIIPLIVDSAPGLKKVQGFAADAAKQKVETVLGVDTKPAEKQVAAAKDKMGKPITVAINISNVDTISRFQASIKSGFKPVMVPVKFDLGNVPQQLGALHNAANSSGAALARIAPGARQADNALLSLNRIVQDAPYGFIGISNNINPMLESFQRLKAETGSTGGALKAMAKGLAGGGGLGLAIAAVTTTISFATIGFDMWKSRAGSAAKATDELAKRQKEFDDIVKNSNQTAAEQIGKLNTLAATAGNVSLATNVRRDALKQLQDLYPSYLKNVTMDDATNGNLANTLTTRLIPAIIAAAKARAYQGKIDKITAENLDREDLLKKQEQEFKAAAKTYGAAKTAAEKAAGETRAAFSAGTGYAAGRGENSRVNYAGDDVKKTGAAMVATRLEITKTNNEVNNLTNSLLVYTAASGSIGQDGRDIGTHSGAAKKNVETLTEAIAELTKQMAVVDNNKKLGLTDAATAAEEKIKLIGKAIEEFQLKFKQPADGKLITDYVAQIDGLKRELRSIDVQQSLELGIVQTSTSAGAKPMVVKQPVSFDYIVNNQGFEEKMKRIAVLQKKLLELGVSKIYQKGLKVPVELEDGTKTNYTYAVPVQFVVDEKTLQTSVDVVLQQAAVLNSAVKSAATDSIAAFAEGIGEGGIANAFSKAGAVIGNAMKSFGKELISGGITLLMAQKALKSAKINPVAMIAAGAALVMVGSAVVTNLNKKSSQPIQGFADGGAAFGPMMGLVGEGRRTSRNNPEFFMPLDRIKPFFSDMINDYISGTNKATMGMGTQQGAVVSGDVRFEIAGDNLVGVLAMANKRQGRIY